MEICVNDYIRTKNGTIAKIKDVEFEIKTNMFGQILYEVSVENNRYYEVITKHSKNIIDLIEEDDIVILEYYVRKYGQRITRKFEVGIVYGKIYFDNRHCSFWYDLENKKWGNGKGFNPKIKSILTKELFNQNSFKL